MAKIKYYYDTDTCQYKRVQTSKGDVIINLLGFLIVSTIFGLGIGWLYTYNFPSQKELNLVVENRQLLNQYNVLNKEISQAGEMLATLQDRDDKLYRAVFEAEPMSSEIRKGGTGGSDQYKEILNSPTKHKGLIVGTFKKLDLLKRRMYVQTKSYDELVTLAKNKNEMMASIPAIYPISKNKLIRFASGFGMRVHPIYKVRKMHTGVDLTAKTGTPIYSSGDGVVVKADWGGGYGKMVVVDHGYGYKTRYAHMSKFKVKKGDKIKRGTILGHVGTTGTSTSPHLHYEVLHNERQINPVNYFFNDLTPSEYDELLEVAAQDRQSLGGGY